MCPLRLHRGKRAGLERTRQRPGWGFGCVPHSHMPKPSPDHTFGSPPQTCPLPYVLCVTRCGPAEHSSVSATAVPGARPGLWAPGGPGSQAGEGSACAKHTETLQTPERRVPLLAPRWPWAAIPASLSDEAAAPHPVQPFPGDEWSEPLARSVAQTFDGQAGAPGGTRDGLPGARRGQSKHSGGRGRSLRGVLIPSSRWRQDTCVAPSAGQGPHQQERRPSPEAVSPLPLARV